MKKMLQSAAVILALCSAVPAMAQATAVCPANRQLGPNVEAALKAGATIDVYDGEKATAIFNALTKTLGPAPYEFDKVLFVVMGKGDEAEGMLVFSHKDCLVGALRTGSVDEARQFLKEALGTEVKN